MPRLRLLSGLLILFTSVYLFTSTAAARAVPTAPTFWVNTQFDGVFPSACAGNIVGECTLREAVLEANATSGATINLPGLLAGQFYYIGIPPSGADDGTTGDLHIDADMNIIGKPTFTHPSTTIDASLASDRVFYIPFTVNVNISNVTIRNGMATDGGGIYSIAALTLTNTTVFSNTASASNGTGGGIYNGGTLALNNSTVSGNTVTATNGYGGGIYNNATGSLTLNNSTISGNTANMANGNGGGIYNVGTSMLNNSTIMSNTTNMDGAGIYNNINASLSLTSSTVMSNTSAIGGGGGIFNTGTLSLTDNTTVSGNTARSGGGILHDGGTMALSNTTVNGNTANENGGGIYFYYRGGLASLSNSAVMSNTAMTGGGFSFDFVSGGSVSFNNVTVTGNLATFGGGIATMGGTPFISNVTVSGNSAGDGGGIYVDYYLLGGTTSISNVTVSNNTVDTASTGGGGIYNKGSLSLSNVTISSNTVITQSNGGGIFNTGTLTLTNSTVSNNSSGFGGGMYNQGVATLGFGTLSGNNASTGGGIYENAATFVTQTVYLANTIVANSAGGNCATANVALKSNGDNLSDDGTCVSFFNQTGDLNNIDPKLGPLADNGGSTATHAPLLGSPAIDAIPFGTNGCGTLITVDQRGMPRPFNGKCDIGAVEYSSYANDLPLVSR